MAGVRNMESMEEQEGKGTGGVDWSGRDVLDLINAPTYQIISEL